jgi:hypothetical protein
MNFFIIFWGTYITFLVSNNKYLDDNPNLAFSLMFFAFLVFYYIPLYLFRCFEVEESHWKIINNFEKYFPKKLKYSSYEHKATFTNKEILLFLTSLSPLVSLWFSIIIIPSMSLPLFIKILLTISSSIILIYPIVSIIKRIIPEIIELGSELLSYIQRIPH